MSRVFLGPSSEGSVQSVGSDAVVNAYSASAWIFITDTTDEGLVFVKDPVGSYFTFMILQTDGTLFGSAGTNDLGGIGTVSANGGTSYHVNDTGVVTGGNPDIPDNEATYIVQSVDGSNHATGVGINDPGQGYANGNTYGTTRTSGTGSGLTLLVNSVINVSNASSISVESVPLNTWTHVAMTWDSNGDGLVHIYINGVECTYQDQRTFSNHPDTSTGPFVIGDDLNDFTLTGSVAEVAVFGDTALTSAQVLSIANSTTGVPSALSGVLTDYWHLCGLTNPEPNVKNPTNVGTVTNSAKGANSPGYTSCSGVVRVATKETITIGEFGGSSLATAFFNPSQYDLIQVLNEGGEVVWNLDYQGNANVNPASPTKKALVGSYYGVSFAIAFPNPLHQDVFQVVGAGDIVHFWVDYQGNAHSA